jgi:hypothetical protein
MTNTRIGKSVGKSGAGRPSVMEQHKREVESHDLEKPFESSAVSGNLDIQPAGKWERKLFLVSEIEGAASTEAVASAVIQDSSASPTGLSREREVEERAKRFQEREERKRAILGVHYLDEDGSPKLLFPLSGDVCMCVCLCVCCARARARVCVCSQACACMCVRVGGRGGIHMMIG